MTTISAEVISCSTAEDCPTLWTLQLRYPRVIHSEFMTHRMFSRNASSSRAVPVKRLIQDVLDDPYVPIYWGKNQKGMQAEEECRAQVEGIRQAESSSYETVDRETAWLASMQTAIDFAQSFADAGYHKQIVNRLLEPFSHINVVVTATEWDNFFSLRDHPAAMPEFRRLARAIKQAMDDATPTHLNHGEWHAPYTDHLHLTTADAIKISTARCARVSYKTTDGGTPTYEQDFILYEGLFKERHMSPFEHQATPDRKKRGSLGWKFDGWLTPHLHGNLRGWIQHRKTIE